MDSCKYSKTTVIRNFKQIFLMLIVGLIITACQNDDDQSSPETSKNGFWLLEGKGYILETNDEKSVLYSVNSIGCTVADDNFDAEESFGATLEQVGPNELIVASELSASDIEFKRLTSQNELCLPDQIADTNDPKVNYDHFWNIFNDHYAFFETRNVDWMQYKNLGEQINSDNFYTVLEEVILQLKDGHVLIEDEANNINIDSGSQNLFDRLNSGLSGDFRIESFEDYNRLYGQRLETIGAKYLGGVFEFNENQTIAWGAIDDNIGYINIFGMAGFGTGAGNELEALNTVLDNIMDDIKDAELSKLIIDVRFNGGGFDMVAVNIASRFVDQERLAFSKKAKFKDGFTESTSVSISPKGDFQFTGDIVLLTSPFTASATEVFMLCMKDLPYVTIVGDHTSGIFSDVLVHVLPNGASVGLSNEVYSDAQGQVFEAIGIGPDDENRVPLFSNDDFIEEKDGGIDKAVEILNN